MEHENTNPDIAHSETSGALSIGVEWSILPRSARDDIGHGNWWWFGIVLDRGHFLLRVCGRELRVWRGGRPWGPG